jgi:double-strand break repair protein MRE11
MPPGSSSDANTFRFLVTTDNHLGFQEKDPRRCHDTFVSFEECLRAATIDHNVDAILLAGDLFHESKPSLHVMNRSIGLLRKYVMGSRPIEFSLLSDPAINFPDHPIPCANFQDPNLNVAVPVFTIHGNHDDPLGEKSPSPVDVLAASGLVNHFGHIASVDAVVVRPVLLQKGSTFIALYGLGAVHDQRLHRCFERRQVQFLKPSHPPSVNGARWFNILLFHQNRGVRVSGGPNANIGSQAKAGIPEAMLRGYGFDIVIWGNEHEQLMMPQSSDGFDIIQPGSTIMTSLSASESNPKQYGVLEVRGAQYRITPHPLTSIRPAVRRQVELWRDQPQARSIAAVEEYLRSIADEMLGEAEGMIARIPDDVLTFHPDLKYPLMRLSVDFSSPDGGPSYPQPNAIRFGQQFLDVVVNAADVLKPMKPKPKHHVSNAAIALAPGQIQVVPALSTSLLSTTDIRTKIATVFNANARDACLLLSEAEVASSIYLFADKDSRDAISETIERLVVESNKSIWKSLRKSKEDITQVREDKIRELALKYKLETTKKFVESSGNDPAAELAPLNDGNVPAERIGVAGDHPDDEIVHQLLGLGTRTGGEHRLGVPIPKSANMVDGNIELEVDHEDEARIDAELDAELERLLPKGVLAPVAPDIQGMVGVNDDDDVVVVQEPPAAGRGRGAKNTVAGKRGRGGGKSKRERDDDVEFVSQRPAPVGKKPVAAPSGPQLALTTGPLPPPPVAQPPLVQNIMSHWTR